MRGMWAGAALTIAALPIAAQAADRTGYRAITSGQYDQAARRLEAERRIHPQRPALMINLAAAYRRTGRAADARALYADALARPAVMLDLPDGRVASSRDLAAAGLAQITTEVATR